MGHTLKGYIYSYENQKPQRLIVFDHGFGGGHLAYMKEIEKLCRHGYRVFAYDHTGCMTSGGESPNGLSQSLSDLNDCLSAIKSDAKFSGLSISVVGHSWGAFSTMNITALHPEVTHVVAMCGFVSAEKMIESFFSGLLSAYRRAVLRLETEANPRFSTFNAANSLKNSSVKALLIYSEDDKLCRITHYEILKEALGAKDNVSFMLVSRKGHNPNYTENAVKLLSEFSKERAKLARKKNLSREEKERFVASFDWEKMTEQDERVWKRIFEHLDS